MGRNPKISGPSFFKVLIRDDFTTKLRLPLVFVEKHGSFVGENARLKTNWGEIWDVKLVKEEISSDNGGDDDDGKYWCFCGEGWTKFVRDLDIKLREFLVFFLVTPNSITLFEVSVYGTNCCLRQISDMPQQFDSSDNYNNVPDNKRRKSEEHLHPCFQIVMTENRKSRWCLPKKFVEAAGLLGKRAVVLEYPPKQRYWAVILEQSGRSYPTLDISVGWNDFRKDNELVSGRTYSFGFDPTRNVIQVKEINHK